MKLIVVTAPTFFVEEDKIITALFEEGLDILHLRKPSSGTRPARTGLLPLASLVMWSLPFLSADNQAHPEPNKPTAAALNSFLKF